METRSIEASEILSVEPDASGKRSIEAEDRAGRGRLATAGLADERERPPALDLEVDPVDRADPAADAAEDPRPDRKPGREPFDAEQRIAPSVAHVSRGDRDAAVTAERRRPRGTAKPSSVVERSVMPISPERR
jgi:hypothetical protein